MADYANLVNSLSPVVYYRLGESSGTVAVDETTNYDGTYINTPTLNQDGLLVNDLNTAVKFGETEEHIAINDTFFDTFFDNDFSFTAIINSNNLSIRQGILAKRTADGGQVICWVETDGNVKWEMDDGPNAISALFGNIEINKLYHLVVSYNHTTKIMKTSINGSEDSTDFSSIGIRLTTNNMQIGCGDIDVTASSIKEFKGIIDEVALFDYALSENEATDLYNASLIGSPAENYQTSVLYNLPVAYWRLGESSGTNAVDEIGNNDGTYVNSPDLEETGLLTDNDNTAVGFFSNDYMYNNNHTLYNTSIYSISMIIQVSAYPATTQTISRISNLNAATSQDKRVEINSDGMVRFYIYNGIALTVTSTNAIPLNEPVFICAMNDGVDSKIYVNTDVDTLAAVGSYTSYTTATQYIAGHPIWTDYFDGIIDEINVYDYALSDKEVYLLYLNSKGKFDNKSYVNTVNALSPMAYWRLGESSGTNAVDEIGNYDGTYINTPTLGTKGLLANDLNKAVEFNGVDEYITTNIPRFIDGTDDLPFSFSVIINFNLIGDYKGSIFSNWSGNPNDGEYIISLNSSGYIIFQVLSGLTDNRLLITTTNTVHTNQTYNILCTYDASKSISGLKIYIDGILQTVTEQIDGTYSGMHVATGTSIASIGVSLKDNPTYYRYSSGTIDEVAIFDYALSQDEVTELYNASIIGDAIPSTTKTFDIVIDHTKVDEDLYDFPLLVNLGKQSGIENFDTLDIFDELTSITNNKITAIYKNPIDNTTDPKFKYYRLFVNNSRDINTISVVELHLYDNDVDLAPHYVNFSASQEANGSNIADYAFDNNNTTKWTPSISDGFDEWVKVELDEITTINSFKIIGCILGQETFAPKDFILQGSNNDIDWTDLHTVINGAIWTALEEREYFISPLTASDDTIETQECKTEIDRWDDSNKESQLWIKVPYISKDVDTRINLSYNSTNAENSDNIGATGTLPAQTVWSEYDAVYHLSNDGVDSTVNELNGDDHSTIDSSNIVDFNVGKGLSFNQTDEYIEFGDNHSIGLNDWHFTTTFNTNDLTIASQSLYAKSKAAALLGRIYIMVLSSGKLQINLDTGSTIQIISSVNIIENRNYTLDIVWDRDSTIYMYIDGVFDSSYDWSAYNTIDLNIPCQSIIGGYNDFDCNTPRFDFGFSGNLQEMRLTNNTTTAEWVGSSYNSKQDTLVTYVEAEKYVFDNIIPVTTKAFDILIDHSKVDEDLYDFPLLINLDETSGVGSLDTTNIFTELDDQDVDDDFTGTDGDLPNEYLWEIDSLGLDGVVSVENNTLKMFTSTDDVSLYSNYLISGDFDIQIDMDLNTFTGDRSLAGMLLYKQNGDFWYLYADKDSSTFKIKCATSDPWNLESSISIVDTVIKIRIVRINNIISYKYFITEWVDFYTSAITGLEDIFVSLSINTLTSDPDVLVYFDNFKVNSGTIVWPTDILKTIKTYYINPEDAQTKRLPYYDVEVKSYNPTAYYRLNENFGTLAFDENDNYDGTYINSPTLETTGLLINDTNNSVSFNGIDQSLNLVSGLLTVLKTNTGTISFIAKFPTDGKCQVSITDTSSTNDYIIFNINETEARFEVRNNSDTLGTEYFIIKTNKSFAPDKNYHVVFVQDDTVGCLIYINGMLQNVSTEGTIGNKWINAISSNELNVNKYLISGTTEYYESILDELVFYTTALSAGNIKRLYNKSIDIVTESGETSYSNAVNLLNPVAYWRLGEGSGIVAVDEMGLYDGEYINTPILGTTGLLVDDDNTAVIMSSNNYMKSPIDTSYMRSLIQGDISMSFSINLSSLSTSDQIIGICDGNSLYGFGVLISYSGGTKWSILHNNGVFGWFNSTSGLGDSINLNTTYHVVAVSDNGHKLIYINGILQFGETVSDGDANAEPYSGIILNKGVYGDVTAIHDEVALFDYALSVSEVEHLYDTSKATNSQVITTICKTEIDRWDQINQQAQLWIKVPYISKDVDTILNLSYDAENGDNSDYIDYTGATPAQAVWTEYDAVYHLSTIKTHDFVDLYLPEVMSPPGSGGSYSTADVIFPDIDGEVTLADGYIDIDLYVNDATKYNTSNFLYLSSNQSSASEYITFYNLDASSRLVDGWQTLTIKMSTYINEPSIDLTAINFISYMYQALPGQDGLIVGFRNVRLYTPSAICKDSTVNALDGNTINMDGTNIVDFGIGKGLSFNGTDEYIDCGDVNNVGLSDFSLHSIVEFSDISGQIFTITKTIAQGAIGRYYQYIENNSSIVAIDFNGVTSTKAEDTIDLVNNNIYTLNSTINRRGLMTVGLNGNMGTSVDISANSNVNLDTNFPFRIGAYTDANGSTPILFTNGMLKEIRFAKKLQSENWIASNYNSTEDTLVTYVHAESLATNIGYINGVTKINGVETSCKVYIYDTDMVQVDFVNSESDGTFSSTNVLNGLNYYVVVISNTGECPEVSGLLTAIDPPV